MKYLQSAKRQLEGVIEAVYTLVDISGSMYQVDYLPSRLEGAIQANKKFIETKAKLHPEDRVGIIAFDNRAYHVCPLIPVGEGSKKLYQSLDKDVGDDGGTNFTPALKMASEKLLNSCPTFGLGIRSELSRFFKGVFLEPSSSEITHQKTLHEDNVINRRIIMLTDGHHNGPHDSLIKLAKCLKDSGVTIECIGIAGNPESVDELLLKKIASKDECGNPRYYFIKDTSELVRKYESMAHHLRVM